MQGEVPDKLHTNTNSITLINVLHLQAVTGLYILN